MPRMLSSSRLAAARPANKRKGRHYILALYWIFSVAFSGPSKYKIILICGIHVAGYIFLRCHQYRIHYFTCLNVQCQEIIPIILFLPWNIFKNSFLFHENIRECDSAVLSITQQSHLFFTGWKISMTDL